MASHSQSVNSIYQSVVEDVMNGVREAFLDEGMDEQVLQELKQLWENKLMASKAIDAAPAPQPIAPAPPPTQQIFAPYSSNLRLMTTTQPLQMIPPAHSNNAAQSLGVNPPMAHQNSQLHGPQPLNLQGVASGQTMSHAAQTAVLSYQNQVAQAQAQGRLTALPNGQVQLANGQVFQLLQPNSQVTLIKPEQDNKPKPVVQLDGIGDSSSDEDDNDDDNDDDDDDDDDEVNEENDEAAGEEEEPLNTDDDVSDADPTEVFDAENVVVCQFDKINRCKNKWKFHLKDGIMNLNGKDYVFQKATGDAEW